MLLLQAVEIHTDQSQIGNHRHYSFSSRNCHLSNLCIKSGHPSITVIENDSLRITTDGVIAKGISIKN